MKPGTDETLSSPRSAGPSVTAPSSRGFVGLGTLSVVGVGVYDHHSNVVFAAAFQSRLHQGVCRDLGTARLHEDLPDLLVRDHTAQTVAAEHQPVSHLQTDFQKVGVGIPSVPRARVITLRCGCTAAWAAVNSPRRTISPTQEWSSVN